MLTYSLQDDDADRAIVDSASRSGYSSANPHSTESSSTLSPPPPRHSRQTRIAYRGFMHNSHELQVAALAQPVVDVEWTTIVSPSRTGAERRRSTTTFDQFDDAVVDFPFPSMTPSSMLLDVHSVAAPHDTASWSPHFDGGVAPAAERAPPRPGDVGAAELLLPPALLLLPAAPNTT